jgi:hypothetical protein
MKNKKAFINVSKIVETTFLLNRITTFKQY